MLNFSKLRIFLVIFFCIFAITFALPSFLSKDGKLAEILPDNRINLGLDLRGGSQLTLQVDFKHYLKEQLTNLERGIKSAFRENAIRALPIIGRDRISFYFKDQSRHDEIKDLIKEINNKVEISEDDGNFEISFPGSEITKMRGQVIAQSIEIVRRRVDENGTKEPTIQAQSKNRILLQVPGIEDSSELKRVLGKTAKMTFHFVEDGNPALGARSSTAEVMMDKEGRSYLINREVILSGDLLTNATTTYYEGLPAVGFSFNTLGTRKFAKITRENVGEFFAIVLDGEVVTAPRINTVIAEGSGVISGNFTVQEANEVALLLRAGALPAPLNIIEERTVGPSLGQDSIRSGTISVIAGIILVAVSMVIFYGIFGLVANFALLINMSIIIAVLALIGANLTLPGIAGIVLTMGMAVDANILIFERIKEELRQNKKIFFAIDQGFRQAFRTIFDSNITTLIVAFFLFAFGSGPVKGFAATLSIGILSSMFSAIILTRMIIALWLKKTKPSKLNLI